MKWRERRDWGRAKSMDDLAERTVRWLDGGLQETPGHLGPPDEETHEIRDDLRRFNQRGFLTTCSQPGQDWETAYDGQPWSQRAFVEGYARPEVAARIEAEARASRCEHPEHEGEPAVTAHRQRVADMPRVWDRAQRRADREVLAEAVTLHGEAVNTAAPPRISRADYDTEWSRGVSGEALAELEGSERVTAVDNHWGVSRHLWDTVGRALGSERVDEAER